MNRIEPYFPTLAPSLNPSPYEPQNERGTVDFGKFSADDSRSAPHTLFAPLNYERKYSYPLIVWLHGPRDTESQLRRVMPLISMRNYVAVAPQGTTSSTTASGKTVYGWGESNALIQDAEDRVFDCIEAADRRFSVDRNRIFLAGLFEGGTLAYRIAFSQPQAFAGVISLGGPFPDSGCPLLNLDDIRRLPIMLAAGRTALNYCETAVCDDLRLMHTAGMTVTLRQYPCADELTTNMLADMDRWIMELVCQTSEALSA